MRRIHTVAWAKEKASGERARLCELARGRGKTRRSGTSICLACPRSVRRPCEPRGREGAWVVTESGAVVSAERSKRCALQRRCDMCAKARASASGTASVGPGRSGGVHAKAHEAREASEEAGGSDGARRRWRARRSTRIDGESNMAIRQRRRCARITWIATPIHADSGLLRQRHGDMIVATIAGLGSARADARVAVCWITARREVPISPG